MRTRRNWVAAIAITAVAALAGYVFVQTGYSQAATPTTTVAAVKAQTECPIMGGKIDKKCFADYQGKRVYFCCAGCIDTFKKDPAKYIKQMEAKGITLDKTPAPAAK